MPSQGHGLPAGAEVKAAWLNARAEEGARLHDPGRGVEGAASLTGAVPDRRGGTGPREKGASAARRPRFARRAAAAPWARLAPYRRARLRCVSRDFSASCPDGCPGVWIRHHRAIFGTRAARSLRKWPVLHFGVEVGQSSPARRAATLPICGVACEGGAVRPGGIR